MCFIIIVSLMNRVETKATVAGINAKKCVQMSRVIMPSPPSLGKVKIWFLIGQTPVQEFVSFSVSIQFFLSVIRELDSKPRIRENRSGTKS